ncbi:hypothetical protein FH972_007675 [Carpinus fangiana]|uniref:Uncharacterized protein n=1 Tax=Carpinus fangiana TaxID=176857 RepID=A0A5N6QZQ3_9ROSI|nr:hypothetical protein FH972_007675 [Carpinus fangiana]
MLVETAKRKRAPFLALLLVMVMILLHTSDCEATSSIMKGNASSPYHARVDEAADYWMFDSEITRMLADKNTVTGKTGNPGTLAFLCGRGKPYTGVPCSPQPNPPPRKPENCASKGKGGSTYNRSCL